MEEKLWESGALGMHSPQSANLTFMFINMKCLGLRSRKEQRILCFGDITVQQDEGRNLEYLQLLDHGSKNRDGSHYQADARPVPPKVWATLHPTRCPVMLWKSWVTHRPAETKRDDSPLFLSPRICVLGKVWYKNGPLGKHQFSPMWKEACKLAGIPPKTGHAGRKTLMKAMGKADVPSHYQVQISGHKSTDSIKQYNVVDDDEQYLISNVLTKTMQPEKKTQKPCTVTSSSSLSNPSDTGSVWRDSNTVPHWMSTTNQQINVVPTQHIQQENIPAYGNMFSGCTFSGCTFYSAPPPPQQFRQPFRAMQPPTRKRTLSE
jgi:hypothetical protein